MNKSLLKRLSAVVLALITAIGILPATGEVTDGTIGQVKALASEYEINNPTIGSDVIWDCIWFGSYPQTDVSGVTKEPIKWRVLSVNGEDAFIIADLNLDRQTMGYSSWDNNPLRTWLNEDFYNRAFNDTEKESIIQTRVKNDIGDDTADKVFLLSVEEVKETSYGFINDKTRIAQNSAYTIELGAITSDENVEYNNWGEGINGTGYWLLRTTGNNNAYMHEPLPSRVTPGGHIDTYGFDLETDYGGTRATIRPVLHLDLSSLAWSYAGTVSSDGTVNEVEPSEWVNKTGWQKVNGAWYFYDTDGTKVVNTWKKDSKGWCYLGKDGKMVTNGWAKDSKGWCWMGPNGYWVTNKWILDKGEWYYIKSNGYMAANEWAKDSGGWYYMNGSGKITKNAWTKDSKGWMYMDANGRITKNKWVKSGGYWYYLKSNGYMATGILKISGKTYKFDSAGRWIS